VAELADEYDCQRLDIILRRGSGQLAQSDCKIIGLGIADWAFYRSRKWGYLVVALYFALLLVSPLTNRVMGAQRSPDVSAQTQQKIDAAVQQAVNQVLAQEGRPVITSTRNRHFPLGSILLVIGLWLLARREPHRANAALAPKATGP
jgi:hypothetical protein